MKKLTLAFIISVSALTLTAQKMSKDLQNVAGQTDLKKGPVIYLSGYNQEVDDNVMWTLKKYWTFGGEVSKKSKKGAGAKEKNTSYITIDDIEQKGDDGDFYNTRYMVSNQMKVMGRTLDLDVITLSFDNMIKKSDKEKQVTGTDKNMHLIAQKAIVYSMLYCSLMKNYAFPAKNLNKYEGERNKVMLELKEKYKNTTVLIPTEILDNGISKDAFAGMGYKHEFESTDNIIKRIKEGTNARNYSMLFFIKASKHSEYVYIVDLETGDMINTGIGGNLLNGSYEYMNDADVKKLLGELY